MRIFVKEISYVILLIKSFLKMCGLDILSEENKYSNYMTIVTIILLFVSWSLNVRNLIWASERDLSKISINVVYFMGLNQAIIKGIQIKINKKKLLLIFEWIKSLYSRDYNKQIMNSAQRILTYYSRLSLFIIRMFFVSLITSTVLIVLAIMVQGKNMPMDLDLDGIQKYLLNYLLQSICLFYSCLVTTSYDSIFCLFSNHIFANLDILSENINFIKQNNYKYIMHVSKNKDILQDIHILYIEILKIIHLINDMLLFGVINIFLTVLLQLCFSIYLISNGKGDLTIYFVFLYNISMLFFYTTYGNLIYSKAQLIPKALYSLNWYQMPVDQRKSLILLLAMTQQPLILRGAFFALSYSNFLKIMRAAFSYAAILKTISIE